MKCCGACFSDRYIREEIARLSVETGECQYCKTEGVPIVDANFLADKFELVIGIYEIDPEGNRLIDWLIEDWDLFAIGRAEAMIFWATSWTMRSASAKHTNPPIYALPIALTCGRRFEMNCEPKIDSFPKLTLIHTV